MALHFDPSKLIRSPSCFIRHNLNPLWISTCETFYFVKYKRRTDLISIHEICVAITLFEVPIITWLGKIDISYFKYKFSPVRYECSLYDIIHIVIKRSWTQHLWMIQKAIRMHFNFQNCKTRANKYQRLRWVKLSRYLARLLPVPRLS